MTMFAKTKFMLSAAVVLGTASAALAMAQYPSLSEAGSTIRRQVPTNANGSDRFAPAPGQKMRMTAVYFDPNPATFNSYTYCASVQLGPSTSKRMLQGELRFPAFSATPNASVQIISSISAAPMQVSALRIEEIPGTSGLAETQIVIVAETILDVPANGIYYANLVVTGVPVIPPTTSSSTQLSQ
jgi:hypothetical protein